jgi:hypothetical protein
LPFKSPRKVTVLLRVQFKIACYGASDASVLSSYMNVMTTNSEEFPEEMAIGIPISLPKILSPRDKIHKESPIEWSEVVACAETNGAAFVHFRIYVRYTDTFETNLQWEIESRYTWQVKVVNGEIVSWWEKRQEDKEQQKQRPN